MGKTALIAVDVQDAFRQSRNGSLGVDDTGIVANILAAAADVDFVVATGDRHPRNHVSFVEQGGPWPVHCVDEVLPTDEQNTSWRIDDGIFAVADLVVAKAYKPHVDCYSAFRDTNGILSLVQVVKYDKPGGGEAYLGDLLHKEGVDHVIVTGIATDYCVFSTARDALAEDLAVTVLRDACAAVNDADGEARLNDLAEIGVTIR